MKKPTHTMSAFSLMDLPSAERTKLDDQIIERAMALWSRKQDRRLSPLNALRRAERETLKLRH